MPHGSAMAHPEAQGTAAPQGQHAVQQKVHSESQKPQEAMAPTASGWEGATSQIQDPQRLAGDLNIAGTDG